MRFLRPYASVPQSSFLWMVLALCQSAVAQTPPAPADSLPQAAPGQAENVAPAPAEQRPKDEVSTRDGPATFRVRVNLVQVRVVVRDEHGKIVPDLHREDFQIFDNRKPQLLSTFNVETPESKAAAPSSSAITPADAAEIEKAAVVAKLPQRFVAMVFDD